MTSRDIIDEYGVPLSWQDVQQWHGQDKMRGKIE